MADTATMEDTGPQPHEVVYCGVCSLPPEYCEFQNTLTRCKEWLAGANPEIFARLYSTEAITEKTANLSLEAREKAEKDAERREAKQEAREDRQRKKRMASKVVIRRIERTKRKHVTAIVGMEAFDVDLKKAAKLMAQKFATGASVARNAANQDEIVIQGDVSEDVYDLIVEKFKEIPDSNIEIAEDKPKKK